MGFISKIKNKEIIERVKKKSIFKRYFNFTIGCLLIAISYNLFLASNDIVAGGISGVAIILNELFDLSNSLVILIFNVLLLILSYFLLGKEKTKNTEKSVFFIFCAHFSKQICHFFKAFLFSFSNCFKLFLGVGKSSGIVPPSSL